MKATIEINIEANSPEDLESAFNRLTFDAHGLQVQTDYRIRKKGKQWIGKQWFTTTPDEVATDEQ